MTTTGAMSVRHEPACISSVRRELSLDLDLHGASEQAVDDAAIVISELVSNALRHGGVAGDGELHVTWTIRRREVLICVDDRTTCPPVRCEPSATSSTGRGLAIVAALAADWGYERTRTGKRVWAVVALRAGRRSA